MNKIKFICNAARWFDKVNGNTYHSVRVTRVRDNKTITAEMQYGYGDHYRQTALRLMADNKWISARYAVRRENGTDNLYAYERENHYPIMWNVSDGLKRDCKANGEI